MRLRNWQQEIIDAFPSIINQHRRFILKAPTGAGKTVLASEIVARFYKDKKIVVLCHRLVLLEQLERALSKQHRVRKLTVSDKGPAFEGYEILLSTNMRAKDVLSDAIPKADLIIVDEAHRVSPNGTGYKRIIEDFEEHGKKEARFMGLTASPERRTGDQRDQLNLAFDAIIDCADIETLIAEGILVPPVYRPHFVHDLDLSGIDISSGDFPVSKLSPAIVKSSMIDYAMTIYNEERLNIKPRPISAWFCPDVMVAEATLESIRLFGIEAAIVTAQTPINERMKLLKKHEEGEIEAMVSVGVLAEGWDNPQCNIIVHLRPTLSKVLWGQSVGRGLRSAPRRNTSSLMSAPIGAPSVRWRNCSGAYGAIGVPTCNSRTDLIGSASSRPAMKAAIRICFVKTNCRPKCAAHTFIRKTPIATIPARSAVLTPLSISTRNRNSTAR
ncbi:MAG: DEAD/DEAH box helicase [Proteobacteria bacterium]|nr:DEAD/DEAH box helicase [Pseudomonadota bacterium]